MQFLPLEEIAESPAEIRNRLPQMPEPDTVHRALNAYRSLGATVLLDLEHGQGEAEQRIEEYYTSRLDHLQKGTVFIGLNPDGKPLGIGQRANIRLDAFPSERFGFVPGAVSDVAADSTEIKDGSWGYSVRVNPDRLFLGAGSVRHQLRPGMTAKIDVITDERRIISYFFAPIVETVQDALSER